MKNFFIRVAVALGVIVAGALSSAPVRAQSGCSYIAYGAVLTAGQWNECFAQKQNVLGFTPVNRAGDTMLGKLTTMASQSSGAGFNVPQGQVPTNPQNGDIWTTLSGLYVRINGVTVGPVSALSSFTAVPPLSMTTNLGVVTFGLDTDSNFSVVGDALALAAGGVAYPTGVSGGAKGAGTINLGTAGLYNAGSAPSGSGGGYVLSTAPTIEDLTVTGSLTATGLVKNSDLVSPTVTINTIPCTLGASCTISATAASITVGTTNVLGGTSGRILMDTAGVLGEVATTGSGDVALSTSPTLASPNFTGTVTGNGTVPNAVLVNSSTTVNGQTCTLGGTCTVTATAATITVGTTGVSGGSNGFILFNDAGTLNNKGTTGTGNVVQATSATLTSPNLVTPTIGVATATSINKIAFTAPATGATLTIADGKTLTASNSLTLTGTDGTSFAFPGASDTVAGLAAAQTLTNKTINCANNTCTVRAANDITGLLPLANGGTNASLTPSNGGIVYSDASKLQILSGTGTAGLCLISNVNSAPQWGSCSGAAAVSSVSNSDSTLTVSPTTGAVVASLNLGNANTWTAAQSFPASGVLIKGSSTGYTTFASANSTGSANTITFPNVTDTVATLGTADQTLAGGANVTSQSLTTGSITVNCGSRPLQYITGATSSWTITAPSNDGSCILLLTNAASSAVIPTFSGFTVGSAAGAALTSTSSAKFYISVFRINGTAGYQVTAAQ